MGVMLGLALLTWLAATWLIWDARVYALEQRDAANAERAEAVAQRRRADGHLAATLELINHLLQPVETENGLNAMWNFKEMRIIQAEAAFHVLEGLRGEKDLSFAARREMAVAYKRIGDVYAIAQRNPARTALARQAYREALTLFRELPAWCLNPVSGSESRAKIYMELALLYSDYHPYRFLPPTSPSRQPGVEVRAEGANGYQQFFLAMAQAELGNGTEARRKFDAGARWMHEHNCGEAELWQVRTEAAVLLGIKDPPTPRAKEESPRKE
jgi:hypothetical protein